MSANDLADRLDLIGAETEFRGVTIYKDDGVRLRAAAVLLREQAEQLDTLRNAIGDPDELLAPAQCPTCGSDDPQTFRSYRPAQDPWMLHGCPDPWHVGGSGDTR